MSKAGTETHRAVSVPEAETAKGLTEAVLDKASELSSGIVSHAQDVYSTVRDQAVDALEQGTRAVSEGFTAGKDRIAEGAGDLGQEVSSLVRRYPLPAFLAAIGVGVMLSRALGRDD